MDGSEAMRVFIPENLQWLSDFVLHPEKYEMKVLDEATGAIKPYVDNFKLASKCGNKVIYIVIHKFSHMLCFISTSDLYSPVSKCVDENDATLLIGIREGIDKSMGILINELQKVALLNEDIKIETDLIKIMSEA